MGVPDAVERYLGTGEHDPRFPDWAGSAAARRAAGEAALRDTLLRVTRWRAQHAPLREAPVPPDAEARVRARVAPLLEGLFGAPRAALLAERLPERVVFLSLSSLAAHLPHLPLGTAWDLANVLLDDVGAPPLADDVPELDGVCAQGRAWVLARALALEQPFPDVITHEVAHLLHTLSAADLGIPGGIGPLVPVAPAHRETFAYACEVWTGALRGGLDGIAARVSEWRASSEAQDVRVERGELDALLDAAVADPAQGWRVLRAWVGRMGARSRTHGREGR